MRSKLLISTAALLAGIGMATAQQMPQGGGAGQQGPAATERGSGAGGQAQPSQRGGQAQQDKGKAQQGAQDREPRGQKDRTTGQGAQGQDKSKAQQGAQDREPGGQRDKDRTTGQGQGQRDMQGQREGQRDQGQREGQRDMQNQGQRKDQGQQSGQREQGQQGQAAGGSKTLTAEQRTRVRETVISGGNAPRVTNVNFALNVGTVVPRSVKVVAVPTVLVEIYPEWRGYLYFVVGDQIVIVDRDYRIIAVISV
jgi:hypothetical protein